MSAIRNLMLIALCIMFSGCYKKYIGTRKICDNNLYVEFYDIFPQDMAVCYLTDSINFRTNLEKFDPAFQNYDFICTGDSVYIQKIQQRNEYMNDTVKIVKSYEKLSLADLKQHKFENK